MKTPKTPEYYQELRAKMLVKFKYSESARGLELIEPKRASCAHPSGYRTVCVDGHSNLSEHRLVWLMVHGEWPDGEVDHINGDKEDNRINNLRLVDRKTNALNRGASKKSTTGIAGIYPDKNNGNYVVRLRHNGKTAYFGGFKTIREAYARLCDVSYRIYGEDAAVRLGRIPVAELGLDDLGDSEQQRIILTPEEAARLNG
jgi:hypothetical protein